MRKPELQQDKYEGIITVKAFSTFKTHKSSAYTIVIQLEVWLTYYNL